MSKLAQGLTDQQNLSDDEGVTKLASSLPERVKKLEVVDLDERDAESEATETSFATSASGSDDHALRIPAIPADLANGDPFECPYCHMVVSISGRRAWKKHVFRDLRPYVCTFSGCQSAHKLYARRHNWFQHERESHRRWWQCIEACRKTFHDQEEFEHHIQQDHR